MSDGNIQLPLVGAVDLKAKNISEAQEAITKAYADGFLEDPRINVTLAEKSTIDVVVLGEVNSPGTYALPKFQNDVGHALAAAGGFAQDAADVIEIHRRRPEMLLLPALAELEGSEELSLTRKGARCDMKRTRKIPSKR